MRSYGPDTDFGYNVHCDLDLGDMTLRQCHDTPLSHAQYVCEILSKFNLALRSYGPDTDFWYVCTMTLTLGIWPGFKVITRPLVMDNYCVKYYPDPTLQWGVMARTRILGMCALWAWRYDLGSRSKVMTHPWVMDNNCVKYYLDPTWHWGVMAWTQIFGICAMQPWPWRYDYGSMSWHTLRSWTIIVWIIIQIGQVST